MCVIVTVDIMEFLTNNPGLQYLSEEIFLNLDPEDLDKCKLVNGRWENVISNPSFLVRKFIQLGIFKNFGCEWKKAVQLLTEGEDYEVLTEHLSKILKFVLKFKHYSTTLYDNHPIHWAAEKGYSKIVELLATSTENSNLLDKHGRTPIHIAATKDMWM